MLYIIWTVHIFMAFLIEKQTAKTAACLDAD